MEEEREKRKLLLQKIEEAREAYANFNREKGLRGRNNENEELLNCVLPGSELHHLIEMTKNLDIVVQVFFFHVHLSFPSPPPRKNTVQKCRQ